MSVPIIGKSAEGDVCLDVEMLVESRMLIQANSGGGKSWAIRRILEETYGQIQHLIIDPEDEFHTLREKYDYVLAGRDGGDCPAEPKSAKLLAQTFLELGVNGIFGIYELKAHERILFVRRFLEALVNAPKPLWHPVLVVLDEAHIFCPEKGSAESSGAVIDLMTRGRKRGFAGILATQRIAKLDKDAAADCMNKLIGRASLDIDMKRAGDEIGFSKRGDYQQLRQLKPGEFYCFGPALTGIVTKVKVGGVNSSHPRVGVQPAPPKPVSQQLKAALAKLTDVPDDHAAAEQTTADLKSTIRSLKSQLTTAKKQTRDSAAEKDAYDRGYQSGEAAQLGFTQTYKDRLGQVAKIVGADMPTSSVTVKSRLGRTPPFPGPKPVSRPKLPPSKIDTDFVLGNGGKARMLHVLVSGYPVKYTKPQWGTLARMKHTGGSFGTYMSSLRLAEMLEESGGLIWASDLAMDTYGTDFDKPQTLEEIRDHWLSVVGGAAKLLRVLFDFYDAAISRDELAERVDMTGSGGSFGTYLSKLRSNKLIEEGPDGICAARTLFEEVA